MTSLYHSHKQNAGHGKGYFSFLGIVIVIALVIFVLAATNNLSAIGL